MSDNPAFISLDEAAAMKTGTRVTFIPGIPALYSEALKNICYVKGVPLIRALHPMMGYDKEAGQDRQARLYELTSQTSLPTMFHDDDAAFLFIKPATLNHQRLTRLRDFF